MLLLNDNREIILNYLTKKLYPLIYQGIESIYQEASKLSKNDPKSILKNFQIFLKKIPSWSPQMIEQEKRRIIVKLNDPDLIEMLIKSYLKLTLIQLTGYSPKIIIKFIHTDDIQMSKIFHNIYIEIARDLYSNPFLLYDKLAPIELKKHQMMVLDIIKEKIKDVIIDILPWDEITLRILESNEEDILGFNESNNVKNPTENISQNNNLNRTIGNISNVINHSGQAQQGGGEDNQNGDNKLNQNNKLNEDNKLNQDNKFNENNKDNNSSKSPKFIDSELESRDKDILKLINEATKNTEAKKHTEATKNTEMIKNNDTKPPEVKVVNLGNNNQSKPISNDTSSMKDVIKDLDESDTSISHIPESENGYADIFTNKQISTEDKTRKLGKNKFFANYLKV